MNQHFKRWQWAGLLGAALGTSAVVNADSVQAFFKRKEFREAFDNSIRYTDKVEFPEHVAVGPNADPTRGLAAFGVAPDGVTPDNSGAVITGVS